MVPEFKIEMGGHFRVRVLRGGECKQDTGFFENIITNGGLNRYGSGNTCWNLCRVGTGNTTPSATDTGLASQVAWTSTKTTTSGVAASYGWRRNVWVFALGAVVGNIAELATTWNGESTAGIFSRALVKDAGGTTTTITVLADEQLEVTWELRFYWPTADTTGSIVNSGNKGGTFNWIGRAAMAGDAIWIPGEDGSSSGLFDPTAGETGAAIFYAGAIGAITGIPTGTRASGLSVVISSYVAASYMREITLSFALARGNAGVTKCAIVTANGSGFKFQFEITPGITKTADDTLSLRFYVSWSRRP